MWHRLGQEQRSRQEVLGPHPSGVCRLGARDCRTSGHSAFANFPGNQGEEGNSGCGDIGQESTYTQLPVLSPAPDPLSEATRPQDC